VGKLAKLSDSQQSIQTLSHWVQYHKSSCDESAVTWAQECLRAQPGRHLLFVYLANDIMQNSKRKGNEFCDAYGAQLTAVLPKIYASASASVQSKMLKVVHILEERRTLDSSLLNEMRARMTGAPVSSRSAAAAAISAPPPRPPPTKSRMPPSATPSTLTVPMSLDPLADDDEEEAAGDAAVAARSPGANGAGAAPSLPLAELLISLDQGSLVDELQAEQEADLEWEALVAVAKGNELSQPAQAEAVAAKAAAASQLLSAHKAKIADELAARRKLILMLASSIESQHGQCEALVAALARCDEMMVTAAEAAEQAQQGA